MRRDRHVTGLIYYLFGPGREAEHTIPHIVAGWRHPAELEPPLRGDGRPDFRHLAGLLQQPHDALAPRGSPRPVWHCSVRAAPDHIHLGAMLARQDGTRPQTWNDYSASARRAGTRSNGSGCAGPLRATGPQRAARPGYCPPSRPWRTHRSPR